MGGLFSSMGARVDESGCSGTSNGQSNKRRRVSPSCNEESPRLIPCLPDELSIQILARVPRIYYYNAKLVSRTWRAATMSHELYNLRKEFKTTEEWLYVLAKVHSTELLWYALDPLSNAWLKLPPMPPVIDSDSSQKLSTPMLWNLITPTIRLAESVRTWLGKGDRVDQLPLCGCSFGAIDGCLYVLGGFSGPSTISRVWRFNPILNTWNEATPMSIGRAYCKTGILNNKLYAVGGVNKTRGAFNPLQSAEVYDPITEVWSQLPNMPFSKAQVLPTAFLADMLKPIATGMSSYMGKLCVPQSLYSWPFIVDLGGEMYDPETNAWVEMPGGMGEGWPARQAGTKLSVVVDGELYALDPSGSVDSKIKVYDKKEDTWKVAISKVPLGDVVDSESPYLLAGFHGRLNVITKDSSHDIAILQAKPRERFVSSSGPGEHLVSEAETDTVVWKLVSSMSCESAELVGCIVLDL